MKINENVKIFCELMGYDYTNLNHDIPNADSIRDQEGEIDFVSSLQEERKEYELK